MRAILKIFVLACLSMAVTACNQEDSVGQVGLATGGEVILFGVLPGEHFASSVDFLGDINGDAIGDIVVGAPDNSEGGIEAGAIYLFFGPLTGSSVATKITGLSGERFGAQVVGVGDLDGDGLGEILASAPGKNRAYLFKGTAGTGVRGPAPLTTIGAQITFSGQSSGVSGERLVNFASQMSRAGDINHDGKLDLAIAATTTSGGGWVGIYLGGQGIGVLDAALQFTLDAASAELKLSGANASQLGASLAMAGDANGDYGVVSSTTTLFGDDLLVGAPGIGDDGGAYLVLGLDGVAGNFAINSYPKLGQLSGDGHAGFGSSVSAIGDLTGDGLDEFAVGFNNGVMIYQGFLQTGFIEGQRFAILGDGSTDAFAMALSGGRGHLRGGEAGLLAGAPQNGFNGEAGGAAFLFGRTSLTDFFSIQSTLFATSTSASIFRGLNHTPLVGRHLGGSVAYGGDASNDDKADALLGMPNFDGAGSKSGAVLVEF